MEEFLQNYKHQLLYTALVVVSVVVLRYLTNLLHKWLIKKEEKRFSGEITKPVYFIKRILNALWLVLGVLTLLQIFPDVIHNESLTTDFRFIFYLGFLSVCTIVGATSVNLWFKQSIAKKTNNNEDPTSLKFLRYVAVYGIYFIGLFFGLLAIPSFQNVAQTALGGAGVIAIIAGIASQEALSNLVGGVFIISFKPFKIGDIIKVTDNMVGTVTDITLRHTIIRNFENKMIVIPNSIINKERLINYDLGEKKCCEHVEIGISYDSNVKLAKSIMQQECENHPLIFDNRSEIDLANDLPKVRVALTTLNDSSVTIRAWAWAANFTNAFQLRIDVLESIKERFDNEGIEIPFPYRTIVMKKEKSEEKVKGKK
ncbi:mechanosensitive ion channel family protein [Roseivirga sp.]|uniref:mechanosensitive ion channel family protein n=1 Tax=Roseivirga sp. TaxID=1964215 RepID=UPI002B26BEC6|nr:mechanosensitive ion channel family protein [Roseivirga sp.]